MVDPSLLSQSLFDVSYLCALHMIDFVSSLSLGLLSISLDFQLSTHNVSVHSLFNISYLRHIYYGNIVHNIYVGKIT